MKGPLPDFKLEAHFSEWEFSAKYHLTASDAESMTLRELLSMGTPEQAEAFESMWLGYTETFGAPALRTAIANTYQQQTADDVLVFVGASEGIFAANTVLLDKDSHAIVITPNYQSHESLPNAIGEVTGVPLDEHDNWSLDIDRIKSVIRTNTKLVTINFPHNPTGAVLPEDRYRDLVSLCDRHGIYILHDEIFNGLGSTGARHLPFIADIYERGLSLNVTSKAYGLPGLRIGWIASHDRQLLSRMERLKHYLSISSSGPSEHLATIALENREKILARNCAIIDENLVLWDAFFARFPELFEWRHPDASCMAYPSYHGADGVEQFTRQLVEQQGVLLLPASVYQSAVGATPSNRFRLSLGRCGLDAGLAAMASYLDTSPVPLRR